MQSASSGQNDYWDILELLTQARQQTHAIAVGQPEIKKHKFWRACIELTECVLFAANPNNVQPMICKGNTYAIAEIKIIFNEENFHNRNYINGK